MLTFHTYVNKGCLQACCLGLGPRRSTWSHGLQQPLSTIWTPPPPPGPIPFAPAPPCVASSVQNPAFTPSTCQQPALLNVDLACLLRCMQSVCGCCLTVTLRCLIHQFLLHTLDLTDGCWTPSPASAVHVTGCVCSSSMQSVFV